MKFKHRKNKKASTSDMMFIAILGLFLGFVLVINLYVYNSFSTALHNEPYVIKANSTAEGILNDYDANLPTTFDTVFVLAFFGISLSSIILAFLVRVSPVFAIISILIMVILMVLVGALATMWDNFKTADTGIASTMNQLPITTYILDHLPLFLLGIWILIFLSMFIGGRL
jgi:hypothetical protein